MKRRSQNTAERINCISQVLHVLRAPRAFTPILPRREGMAPVRPRKNSASALALKLKSGDNSLDPLPRLFDPTSCVADHQPERGRIMAKRKKASKVQKRAKLRSSAKRGKARKAAKAAPAKRTVAKAKPKPAPVKKAARKVKPTVTPVVETVAVEVIEQPAPGVITVTEVEEIRKAS
jgi:hypothetical protein